MDGIYINHSASQNLGTQAGDSHLTLLAKRRDVEIMEQTLLASATVWITPAEDRDTLEFFYVLSGSLALCLGNDQEVTLESGHSFYVEGLSDDLHIKMLQTTKLLYITNRPVFDYVFGYQGDLGEMVKAIDEKDHYTLQHCYNVKDYSVLLMRKLDNNESKIYELATAALFHDVGKCFIPDEILLKPEKLTAGEFRRVMKHPLDSARLLEQKFTKRIADIAKSHHERLDGSGYPYGLSGTEISMEGRIIAVADAFDAMTTQRTYNQKKSYVEAAQELLNMPKKFDIRVCKLLKELVLAGEIPLAYQQQTGDTP